MTASTTTLDDDDDDDGGGAAQVAVTVTTIRAEQEDGGERRAFATGLFDEAVREALQARLEPWAVDQVLGRVLARRPPAEQAARYEGSFHPLRHIRVDVAPAAGEPSARRLRRLPNLFLPAVGPDAPIPTGGRP